MSRYKPYPQYKESGVEWVGSYPGGWALTRVKFESYVKARVGWHGLKSDDFTDEGPYLVTGSDFSGPEIRWENCYHCDLARYEQDPYIQLNEEDLLITKDGTIGKVALVRGLNGKATLNSGVFVVRPLENKYTTKYYFWLLQSNVFDGFVQFSKTGSTIVHLYQDTFVNFKYAMPTFGEQLGIAAFLDHETAKIDALIEKQQRLIELLKEKRQAVISHAVTKGLNPNAPLKDSGVERLGDVPAHWVVGKCGFHISILPGYAFQSSGFSVNDEDTKLLRGINVSVNSLKWDEVVYWKRKPSDGLDAYVVRKGDIVIGMDRPLISEGIRVAKVKESDLPCLLLQRVALIKTSEHLDADYLLMLLSSNMFPAHFTPDTTGVSVPHISPSQIGNFVIPIPKVDEQKQIVFFVSSESRKLLELISKAEEAIALMQERRTALISAAVTGKIDVRDWQAAA
ncbi:restriction endonuclease subunit S [Acidovorax sp. NCPPB 3576]|uniref:restriction endonuclease subunit S n=1 Tax=Acidovorax sp. NCPPB 3576 TaxID=2940488 RepID=UPI002349B715|nr:restriction endonuclease subunit S [Acidovorax sp. NCPPB 3576]WCM90714.1 restriction endonuclease subunit S [Acidovorax sp. NCPPB 3576]